MFSVDDLLGGLECETNEAPITLPSFPVAPTVLLVESRRVTLLYSVEWCVVALVDGKEVGSSRGTSTQHDQESIDAWARSFIRANAEMLSQLNVDVDVEYRYRGGSLSELYDLEA
jgi:hypothetical protein